jgi:hypothetical protein
MKTYKMKVLVLTITGAFLIAGLVGSAFAAPPFSDNFETDLSAWTPKCGASYAQIVEDPLKPGNHVLHFTHTNSYGDIFGPAITIVPGQKYSLSFDYLGYPATTSEDNGGYVGFAATNCPDSANNNVWFWATGTVSGAQDVLVDNGQWKRYTFEFDPFDSSKFKWVSPTGGLIRLMLEQYNGPAGDAYFDNIELNTWLEVSIDIKPGSYPNSINLGSAGVIPVAIFSTETFDATTIDPDTICLAGATVKLVGKSQKALCHIEDVNGDGLLDLVCQVLTVDFMVEEGATTAELVAETYDGLTIKGQDSINIVP